MAETSETLELVLKAKDEATEHVKHLGESLKEIGKIAAGVALGNLATGGLEGLAEQAKELVTGFTEAASAGEHFQTQMRNFYGSTEVAGKVLEWTNQQALKMPFSVDQIRQATAGLASTGQDASKLLPALGNIATAMGTTLPEAVSVFNRALLTGNMRGLVSQLHLSKGELESFGLEVDKSGKIVSTTLAPALEHLASVKFGDAMMRQATTLSGSMTILANQFDIFKELVGEGIFDSLKGKLADIIKWLDTHQETVRRFGETLGHWIGWAADQAIKVFGVLAAVGPPAIALLIHGWEWLSDVAKRVWTFIGTVIQTFVTWFNKDVLPLLYEGLAAAGRWWQEHADAVKKVVGFIIEVVTVFFGDLGTDMKVALDALHGIWLIGWGAISGVLGLALDLMTGNWKQFGKDLDTMAKNIAVGILEVFHALTVELVNIMANLPNPLEALLKKMDNKWVLAFLRTTGHGAAASFIEAAESASRLARGAGVQAATKAIDTTFAGWEHRIKASASLFAFAGVPSSYDTTVADTKKGHDQVVKWIEALQRLAKEGITLPPDLLGGMKGLDLGKLPPINWKEVFGGAGTAADQKAQMGMAFDQAKEQFSLDLLTGAPKKQLMQDAQDIQAIMRQMVKAGLKTHLDATYEWAQDMQSIANGVKKIGTEQYRSAVDTANAIFQYDLDHNAARKKLAADVQRIYKDELPTLGFYGAQNNLFSNQQRITDHFLHQQRLTYKDDSAAMQKLRERFEVDILKHAPEKTVMADIKALVAEVKKINPKDPYAATLEYLRDLQAAGLSGTAAGGGVGAPGGMRGIGRQIYGTLFRHDPGVGADFGQTQVSFLGRGRDTASEIIAALRQQLDIAHQTIARLEAQLAALVGINAGVERLVLLGEHPPIVPVPTVHQSTRRQGVAPLIRR